ncbi:MAG: hypothetical protein ABSB59_16485 [Streptosporangiaceae bacterium]|jgi:hypothetical protein
MSARSGARRLSPFGKNGLATVALVRAASGAGGSAALARYSTRYPGLTYRPATLLHLLLVSVGRRRVEAGLLRAE